MKYVEPNAEVIVSIELLRMILDLPAGYTVVGAYLRRGGDTIGVMVHAPELTRPLPDEPLHLLTPIYYRIATGETELRELRITPTHER